MWIATLDTENYSFEAYGLTHDDAIGALRNGLIVHFQQEMPEMTDEERLDRVESFLQDEAAREVLPGACLRDWRRLT